MPPVRINRSNAGYLPLPLTDSFSTPQRNRRGGGQAQAQARRPSREPIPEGEAQEGPSRQAEAQTDGANETYEPVNQRDLNERPPQSGSGSRSGSGSTSDLDQMDAEDDDVKPTWLDKLRRRSPEQIRKAHRTRQQIRQRADREWLNTRARNLKAEENQERMDMMYPPTRWEKFKRVLRKIKPPEEVGDDLYNENMDLDAQFRNPMLAKMSMHERKSYLIDQEIKRMGMGRYQWMIWSLCGLGYLLDLMWAQAYGLIASPIQQEVGFDNGKLGNIFIAFNAGLCAGAIAWGLLIDVIGRKWAFNLTVLFTAIFGFAIAGPSSYDSLLVLIVFNGFGIGGNVPIDTTISLEFLPSNRRIMLALLSLFQPIGVVISCGIAYGLVPSHNCLNGLSIPSCASNENLRPPDCLPSCFHVAPGEPCCRKEDNMGWRYVVITLGAVSVFVWICRFVIFRFRESPKFLLSKGKLKEAVECLDYLGKVNKNANRLDEGVFDRCEKYWTRAEGLPDFGIPGLRDEHKPTDWNVPDPKPDRHVLASMLPNGRYLHTLTAWEKIKREAKRNKILWHAPFLRLAISVWLIYAFDFWGFAIAGNFLPTILLRKNADLDISLTQTYKDYIIIYAPGILGVAFGAFLGYDPRIGRKWAMVGCATIMALMLFLFAVVNDRVSNITLNCLEYFFQSAFNAVLYGWTPETFPSAVRGTASGAASFWGRLFSIVAPLAATKLLDRDLNGPLYLAGAGVCVAVLVLLSIPGLFFRREFLKSIG